MYNLVLMGPLRCLPRFKVVYRPAVARGLSQNTQPAQQPQAGADPVDLTKAKPFSAIPGPLSLPLIYNLYLAPFSMLFKDGNKRFLRRHKKYGPILKEQYGPAVSDSLISLFDVDEVEKLIRHDGPEPRRLLMESWQSWRDEAGHSRGILIENGPAWKRMRPMLNKQMLRPKLVETYCKDLIDVTADFIERILRVRDPQTGAVQQMDQELFYWSLESICSVLYERRLGGLSESRTEDMSRFIQAVQDMFNTTNYLFFLPRRLNQKVLPRTQALQDRSWAIIFEQGQKEIDQRFREIQKSIEEGQEISGFLSTLLATGSLSMKEIYANVSELMAAAVDTTSNTMQWVLYELTQHPDIQEKIREEVLSITPRGQIPTYNEVQNMTYLKGFLKEILRLYPVANVVSRITNDDIVLAGYHIPPNVRVMGISYVAGRNPEHFPEPEKLKPQRWQRGAQREVSHPYAWMAFGFGSRMCVGRRIAELEIYLLTASLLQRFSILPVDAKPNPPATKPLFIPQHPVRVRFVDRPAD